VSYRIAPRSERRLLAALLASCLGLAAMGTPAGATPASGVPSLDLRVQPGDVALPPPPLLPDAQVPPALGRQNVPEIVSEVDRPQRTETPQRQKAGAGPLGSLSSDEGVLKELLENKTIPLFRVRVAPPF
jgi:hypothetical protein